MYNHENASRPGPTNSYGSSNSASGATSRAPQPRRHFFRRPKSCPFCESNAPKIDYKDVRMLQKFITERGRIGPRRGSAVCAQHQRALATAIKRARFLGLLPFVVR